MEPLHNEALHELAFSADSTAAAPLVAGDGQCRLSHVAAALAAADELGACRESSDVLRLAVELARTRLGLERASLFLRDRSCEPVRGERGWLMMRGTWGTGARGETTDERALSHEISPREHEALLDARLSGGLGVYRAKAPLSTCDAGRAVVIGEGWVMATPLVTAGQLVGVLYNDAALTGSPVDEGKQAAAAVFCTTLALLHQTRRGTVHWLPLQRKSGQGPLVERVVQALAEDLPITGEKLASELGVSPGHLARSFKREMGVSLVDYRNRLRLDRFFAIVQRAGASGNLLDAALQAGFGSYAQFHRVFRALCGTTPREYLRSRGGHVRRTRRTS